ncbi:MAG: type III pantothenate kinase [Saprospiraceae bacterium]|nr:type III pantothenate kinase [Saprospiraceae bacterium]
MNLVVDIGNTRTKLAFFEKNILIEKAIIESSALSWLSDRLKEGHAVQRAIFSKTGADTEGVEDFLKSQFPFISLGHDTPIPIKNQYATPTTLGKDRLAAAVAASFIFPNENVLFIDGGTCITYNVLHKEKGFLGGNIAPGLTMRFRAMHHFTAKLPLIESHTEGVDLIGNSTESAMRTGVQIGILSEIEGFVRRFQKKFEDIKVVLTGGDGLYFFDNLDTVEKYYEPNLVLQGLNEILNYNFQIK